MSSINTNASAMTALQSLSLTNKNLATTQTRISTGLRVADASDNAAYWSIATTMRSDNKAISTVQDALGLGSATVDTAYTGLTSAIETVDEIKKKLTASLQPGVDKDKIQSEINQLKDQLTSISTSASFNGQNWLSVDSSATGYSSTRNFVSSFTRDSSGSVAVGTTSIDVSGVALFDTRSAGTKTGILDGDSVAYTMTGAANNGQAAGDGTNAAEIDVFTGLSGANTLADGDKISFNLAVNGTSHTVTIDKATVDAALNTTDGVIADENAMATVLTRALSSAGLTSSDVTVSAAAGAVTITHAGGNAATDTLSVTDARAQGAGSYGSISAINVVGASESQIKGFLADIETMSKKMTTAASDLGAVKSRIDMQKDFASKLMDAIDRGVGQLVDADMSKESARLSALQVQQQLGIQALSIANSNTQNILSLFR